jgi:hypothetical protein
MTTPFQARDQIGHWVAPPSMRGRPCPHSCCQNKRVHPHGLPVRLDRAYLRSLSEDDLVREAETYSRYSDTHERGYLQILAEDRRRIGAAERRTRSADRRRQRESDYRDEVYREWLHAENGIQGAVMLNRRGKAAGIDERSLFTGPQRRVDMYASDELKEWFEAHPRPTRARILGQGAERRDRMQGAVFGHDPGHW